MGRPRAAESAEHLPDGRVREGEQVYSAAAWEALEARRARVRAYLSQPHVQARRRALWADRAWRDRKNAAVRAKREAEALENALRRPDVQARAAQRRAWIERVYGAEVDPI